MAMNDADTGSLDTRLRKQLSLLEDPPETPNCNSETPLETELKLNKWNQSSSITFVESNSPVITVTKKFTNYLSTTEIAVPTSKTKQRTKPAKPLVWSYTCWAHPFNSSRKKGADPTSISEIICIHNTVLVTSVCPLFIWHHLCSSFFSMCICFPKSLPSEWQTSNKQTLAVHLDNVTQTLPFASASCTKCCQHNALI